MQAGRPRSQDTRGGTPGGQKTSRVFGAPGGGLLGLAVVALCETIGFLAFGWPAPVEPWKVHPTGLRLGGLCGMLAGGYLGIAVPRTATEAGRR